MGQFGLGCKCGDEDQCGLLRYARVGELQHDEVQGDLKRDDTGLQQGLIVPRRRAESLLDGSLGSAGYLARSANPGNVMQK